jgi:hypothetical protein
MANSVIVARPFTNGEMCNHFLMYCTFCLGWYFTLFVAGLVDPLRKWAVQGKLEAISQTGNFCTKLSSSDSLKGECPRKSPSSAKKCPEQRPTLRKNHEINQLDENTPEKDAQLVKAQYESSAQFNAEISANLQAIEYFKGVLDSSTHQGQ